MFLNLYFTFWRKHSKNPRALVWRKVLPSPSVASWWTSSALMSHRLGRRTWIHVELCLVQGEHFTLPCIGHSCRVTGSTVTVWTSDQWFTNIKFSLSHIALFALNSIYGDVDAADLIHFCLYLFNVIHQSWPSVFLRHCF